MRSALPIRVVRLVALPPGFDDLAADAIADGQRMLDVLREDWTSATERFDAFAGDALLGLGGLTRDPYLRGEEAGRVRRFYVRRASRRHGAGRLLLGEIVAWARATDWQRVRVRAPAEAFAFYEACGFLRAVGEASATHVMPLRPGTP